MNDAEEAGEGGWAGSLTITQTLYRVMKLALYRAGPAVGSTTSFTSQSTTPQCPAPLRLSLVWMLPAHKPGWNHFGAQASGRWLAHLSLAHSSWQAKAPRLRWALAYTPCMRVMAGWDLGLIKNSTLETKYDILLPR